MSIDLDAGLAAIDARFEAEQAASNERDRVFIYDRFLQLVGEVFGENDADWEDICNDAGEAAVTIPGEDDLAQFLIDAQTVDHDVFLLFKTPWKRECYKVKDIEIDQDEHGDMVVRPIALHLLDEIKHIQCWPNTFAPLAAQFPKSDTQFGNAIKVIKGYVHRNLLREQQPGWVPFFDIWNAANWKANFDNAKWPMVMIPYIAERDGVAEWCALDSRMENCYDLIKPTLEDAGCQLTADVWFPGDPQPCPSHFILDRPTIVFDVVRRRVASGVTGTILDPIRDLVRIIAPDGTSETVTIADPNDNPNNADPNAPWVIFRRGQHVGLRSKMTIHKPIEHTITTGGKSPDAINQGAKLISNILLGLLGTAIGMPWLTLGIFDKAVEDVILAWAIFTDHQRKARMGPYSHKSGFETGGGVAVSPSGLQIGRVGLRKTRGYVSFAAEVDDNAPYAMGRHIDVGISAGFEIGNRIWLSNISAARRSWSRTEAPAWQLAVGDYRALEPDGTRALRYVNTLTGAVRQISSST